jgi:hypothetical protein
VGLTNFSIYLVLAAAIGPEIYSSSNRSEYQKKEKKRVPVE